MEINTGPRSMVSQRLFMVVCSFPHKKLRFIAEKLRVRYHRDSKNATFCKGRV